MIQTSRSVKMNRRELLGTGAVLMGATVAGIAFEPTAKAETHTGTASAETGTPPNYTPPIVQVDGGQLRGFRDGKTTVFLGIPYAEAERFELPKPVQPWEGVKSAQSWGPVCPIPPQPRVGGDEFVFLTVIGSKTNIARSSTSGPRIPRPALRSRSCSGCTAADSPMAPRWSPMPTTVRI
jgi:hypothetical protein